ncbi:unnamed protein product [Eruca vesicaria subsp. sativa]|uniref:Ethylene insensitive 3-like DNA-binding domain-containing protein n=1 Tax=Eruca vesicaria subsp. sativa TaxID=29727 RepID=A0ABC8IX97_ERUVS|nr:unnamed protein product [Eruca vesicaria subsp. sativa]
MVFNEMGRSNTGFFFSDDNGYTDDEFDVDKLEKRIWRQEMRLKRLKERSKNKEGNDEQLISKYMFKIMEVCNVQGFVYGIISEEEKPVISAASENLQEWWKDKVKFDLNGLWSKMTTKEKDILFNVIDQEEASKYEKKLNTSNFEMAKMQRTRMMKPESDQNMYFNLGFQDKNSQVNNQPGFPNRDGLFASSKFHVSEVTKPV